MLAVGNMDSGLNKFVLLMFLVAVCFVTQISAQDDEEGAAAMGLSLHTASAKLALIFPVWLILFIKHFHP